MHEFWLFQPYNHLIQFQNLKFESERAAPLLSIECMLGVLVCWRLMTWSDAPTSQWEELVKQIQDKINSIENTIVNVVVFQAEALEV